MTPLANELQTYLQGQQPAMLALLRQLVLAESPSSVPAAQGAVQALLRPPLQALGFRVDLIPGTQSGGMLLARPGDAPTQTPGQLLLGHCDTVWPLGTLAHMPLAQEGNQLRGPGVFDMKAGLVQMLFALQALRELGHPPALTPVIFISSDEEIGSPDSKEHICRLAKEANRALIIEPASGPAGKLKTARKGTAQYEILVTGRAAHAGLDPEKGVSAILEMSYIVQKLFALNDPAGGISVNVGQITGGTRPNVIAAECRAVVDVRAPTLADARRIASTIQALQAQTPGTSLQISGGINRPPLERTPANQQLWHTARHLGTQLDLSLEETLVGGGSDGNFTSQYTATLDGLGPVGDGAHARHEFIYLDRLAERAALLALLLLAPPV